MGTFLENVDKIIASTSYHGAYYLIHYPPASNPQIPVK